MEKRFEDERVLERIDVEKRDFLKKVVVGTAFAVPVINSFSMEGLKIDLSGRMAKADDFDKTGGYDECVAGCGGSGGKGGSGGRGGSGGSGGSGGRGGLGGITS
jgi:hypothetical protein